MMDYSYLLIALVGVLIFSLYTDFVGHKDGHTMGVKEATGWSVFYVAISALFGGAIYFYYGAEPAQLYATGYVLEKALSVDNLMVFTAVFSAFGIRCQSIQHKILLWGIAGAIFFRGIFTYVGTDLLALHWSIQVLFGVIILYTAYAMLTGDDEEVDYENHWAAKSIAKVVPVNFSEKSNFFTRHPVTGKLSVTAVFLCMVVIEFTDVMFAFDSVPAVISVTQEPALVYSAMVMAILGLRSLYFVLQALLEKLPNLEKAVMVVLVFVGGKLIAGAFGYHLDPMVSLAIVVGLLSLGFIKCNSK